MHAQKCAAACLLYVVPMGGDGENVDRSRAAHAA
jgi:hypothetical protein